MMPSRRKTAWLEAAWVFGVSRLALFIITALALRFPLAGQTVPHNCASGDCFLTTWYHWDVGAYAGIAAQGYSSLHDAVFFPLWPLLIRGVGFLIGGSTMSYYVAGLLLTNVFFYLALVVFYHLLSEDFEPAVARNALFYLSFAPYGLFFFAGYTESLFLLLSLTVFLCLQRERWWLAGVCGFLAALTRSQGVLLVVPFLVVLVQRFWFHRAEQTTWQQRLRVCLPLALIPLGVVIFMAYLAVTKGDPLAFSTQEAAFWRRHLTIPLVSIFMAFQALWHSATTDLFLLNLLDIVSVFVALALLLAGWKYLPLHYSLFALALILFNISYPQGVIEPLTAVPRYMVIVFPMYIVLATWGKQARIDRIITVCSLSIFTINAVLFISHFWVA